MLLVFHKLFSAPRTYFARADFQSIFPDRMQPHNESTLDLLRFFSFCISFICLIYELLLLFFVYLIFLLSLFDAQVIARHPRLL